MIELLFSPVTPALLAVFGVLYWAWNRWKTAQISRLQLEHDSFENK